MSVVPVADVKGELMTARRKRSRSSLNTAETAFVALCRGPAPLAVQGAEISDRLPQRPIPLLELRRRLLDRSLSWQVRDAVWRELVQRARLCDPAWTVAAVGVAWPGLRRAADRVARGYDGDAADVDGEVLAGFLGALPTIDTTRRRIVRRLCWSAYRAGARFRDASVDYTDGVRVATTMPASRPWGHPELVIERAVAEQVITSSEAQLIASTRLDEVPVETVARKLHISHGALMLRRFRAEHRLAQAILAGKLHTSVFPYDT
ncbi:MAG: hypothetical protein GEU83_20480 [Pseudonocardiaceae bacterium]|nr:hypothetical protein [Pseudonocardiaceae bacterium]